MVADRRRAATTASACSQCTSGNRTTYFLPSICGRLSLYQDEDGATGVDLTYDEDANPASVAVVLAAMREE